MIGIKKYSVRCILTRFCVHSACNMQYVGMSMRYMHYEPGFSCSVYETVEDMLDKTNTLVNIYSIVFVMTTASNYTLVRLL